MKVCLANILIYLSPLACKAILATPAGLGEHDAASNVGRFRDPHSNSGASGGNFAIFESSHAGEIVAGSSSGSLEGHPSSAMQASDSAARPEEISSAPPRELDQEDFDFLDSFAHDLDSVGKEHTSSETRVGLPAPPTTFESQTAVVWKPLAHWNEHPPAMMDPRSIDSRVIKNAGIRDWIGWPGPKLLPQLGLWRPLGEHGVSGILSFEESEEPRDRINAALFANKLKWVDYDKVWTRLPRRWHNRMPIHRLNQRLPFVYSRPSDGKQLRVYMIESNLQRKASSVLHGTPLESAPLYTFWSIPQHASGKVDVSLLGVGYLNLADNEAVDERVRAVLDVAQHFPHIPM
ncbi:hypothetical protein PSEUBRA_006047 [Kalmanozyma brasiliensis GHG001]|uniref:uncharacterized protein n=1 Tax=Kalmanozyma brasiliensis (strain GHG001) TaxID=1365824 RepID=UPI001CE8B036|nr:uncharacterized protein PSEUBRA_006047 [Kalmanozyma brasiliensis GHG001]KAF6767605.1 hypothetical protein PSEUBRA_006047 [Kalmanozyma brasiliensis GHG001]